MFQTVSLEGPYTIWNVQRSGVGNVHVRSRAIYRRRYRRRYRRTPSFDTSFDTTNKDEKPLKNQRFSMILHHLLTPLGIEQGHSFDTSFDTNKPPGGRPTAVRGWRVTLCLELHPWSLSACPVGSILVPNLHSGIHPCSTLSGKSRHCQLESVAQSSVRKLTPPPPLEQCQELETRIVFQSRCRLS